VTHSQSLVFFGMAIGNIMTKQPKAEMKKKIKGLTLVFGVVIAFVAFSTTKTYAEKLESNSIQKNTTIEADMLQKVEEKIKLEEAVPCEKRIKIFNSENRLIYECRGDDDQRLKLLLRRSDLMFQTDSSSYYLLGD